MRILVLNPNTSTGITDRLMAAARAAAAPGTELKALTATRGFPYISTRAEAQVGGAQFRELTSDAQASQRERRILSGGDHQVHLRGQVLDQKGESIVNGFGINHMVIIKDEDEIVRDGCDFIKQHC